MNHHSKTSWDRFVIPLFISVGLMGSLLFTGCGDNDSGDDSTSDAITLTEESIEESVYAIIRESRAESEPYTHLYHVNEDTTWEIEGRHPRPLTIPSLPDIDYPSIGSPSPLPIGTLLLKLSSEPNALTINNQGGVVYSTHEGVFYYLTRRSSFPLLETPADWLQMDKTGERLLIESMGEVWIFSGDKYSTRKRLENPPRGKSFWTGRENQLLFVQEKLRMDPMVKQRVSLSLSLYNIKDETSTPHSWKPMSTWAAIGTLPQIEGIWGHFSQPHQINPIPAKLASINNDGIPNGFYTETETAADIHPCVDSKGNLLWIRTFGYGSSTGRARIKNINDESQPEWQITAEPTYQVAIDPDGLYLATCSLNTVSKSFEIRKIRYDDLKRSTDFFEFYEERDLNNRQKALDIEAKMKSVFQDILITNPDLPVEELKVPPTPELVAKTQTEFRKYLKENFLLTIPQNLEGLMILDQFMAEAGAYMTESPAIVMAIGGLFADALSKEGTWMLNKASANLSSGEIRPRKSDDLSYTAILPFFIAREAIAGRLSLSETANEILATSKSPLFFVENLNADTMVRITESEWIKAGLSTKNLDPDKLTAVIANQKASKPVNLYAITVGHDYKLPDVSMQAALNLCHENKTSSKALSLLASELVTKYRDDLAIKVLESAIELDPFNSHLYLSMGDSLAVLGKLDKARECYLLSQKYDVSSTFSNVIPDRFELLETLAENQNDSEPEEMEE